MRCISSEAHTHMQSYAGVVDFQPGLVLAERYVLVRRLGSGGMSEVWLARNTATGADVAAKVLLAARAASKDALERFRREAHATAQLTHRGIVRVFDLVELDRDQGSLLMIMEQLRGQTLGARLEDEPRLSIETSLAIVLPILSALEYAHRKGIVHRDLKPDNVFLSLEPDGQMFPKLLDFGISKVQAPRGSITLDGELVGTPCYMSPEQAKGRPNVDARSDVFSVGTLLYEMLAGYNPFVREDLHTIIMSIIEYDPPRIERLPDPLWNVLARAMAKDPANRYSGAADVAAALKSAVGDVGSAPTISYAPPLTASIPPGDQKAKRRSPLVYGAAAAILVAAVGAGVSLRASSHRQPSAIASASSSEAIANVVASGGGSAGSTKTSSAIVAAAPEKQADPTASTAAASLASAARASLEPEKHGHAPRKGRSKESPSSNDAPAPAPPSVPAPIAAPAAVDQAAPRATPESPAAAGVTPRQAASAAPWRDPGF